MAKKVLERGDCKSKGTGELRHLVERDKSKDGKFKRVLKGKASVLG